MSAMSADSSYFEVPALSASGMKDLMVSPLRFWYRHVNPDRVEDPPSAEMRFGTALHCAVLQPNEFDHRYARAMVVPEGTLDTMADIRQWISDKGQKPKGTVKADIIAQARSIDPTVQVLDLLKSDYGKANVGKEILSDDDYTRIEGAFNALMEEPKVVDILREGESEVPLFVNDPEYGVPLKCKMDWKAPKFIMDLKTFQTKRDKPIDEAVTDAIWYEGYHRQAYMYSWIRSLVEGTPLRSSEFVFVFIESWPPHEVRIRKMRPTVAGQPSLLWEKARQDVNRCVRLYAEHLKHFGDKPWRYAQEGTQIADEEVRPLAFAY